LEIDNFNDYYRPKLKRNRLDKFIPYIFLKILTLLIERLTQSYKSLGGIKIINYKEVEYIDNFENYDHCNDLELVY